MAWVRHGRLPHRATVALALLGALGALGGCSSGGAGEATAECPGDASSGARDEGWRVLFAAISDRLPVCDQQAIYAKMGLASGPDGASLRVADAPEAGPVSIVASLEDLNGDGRPEVFLVGGSAYLSGATGSSVWLFIEPEPNGPWQLNLGFPAAGYRVLDQRNAGYPDLRFGGMGWCEAVWRWNGAAYEHLENVATAPGGCDRSGGVE